MVDSQDQMDSQYVSRTLGRCLSEGLAELIELRPLDPIEFLSLWILKYKHNQELELEVKHTLSLSGFVSAVVF